MIHVGLKKKLLSVLLLYNKRKKITININTYHYIPKQIKIWNVTVQPRLWESYGTLGIDKKYLWRWCFCVNIDLQVHLQSLTACHHSSQSPYNFYNRCSHFLQQKLPGNNYCPTQKIIQVPAITKTTIVIYIYQVMDPSNQSNFETCNRVDVLSFYTMSTHPLWNDNSSNRQESPKKSTTTCTTPSTRTLNLCLSLRYVGVIQLCFLIGTLYLIGVWFIEIKEPLP